MATTEAEQAPKDVVAPEQGHYQEQFIFVLDEKTLVPVQVRKVYILSS